MLSFRQQAIALLAILGALAILSLAGTPRPGAAASASVTIEGFAFKPTPLTINVGDTVTWTNQDSAWHTATSDTGVWDSDTLNQQNPTYSHTFTAAGTYNYHCDFHGGMTASIIVNASLSPRNFLPIITRGHPGT